MRNQDRPDPQEFWSGKRVCVTGGAGFLGSFVVGKVHERGARDIFVPRKKDYDLVDLAGIRQMLSEARPDIVIHLAARVGGIGANREHPAEFFYENLMMGVQLMHESWKTGVKKFVAFRSQPSACLRLRATSSSRKPTLCGLA